MEGTREATPAAKENRTLAPVVDSALSLTAAMANEQIADGDKFCSGLNKMIDGVADCMNASVWSKVK